MQERIGILDLGSNTARLIVMAYTPQQAFKLLDEVSEQVRLAKGIGANGRLLPEPMFRALEGVKLFHTFCRSSGVPEMIAVATSAVRDATNQAEFLERVRKEVGLELRVLSGQQEAYYGYLGVVNSLRLTHGCVVDIGGGSAQITQVYNRAMQRWFSAAAGVVRFSERYIHSDPISQRDFEALEQAADNVLAEIPWLATEDGSALVGVGGTVRNIARIHMKQRSYPFDKLHAYLMSSDELESVVELLRKATLREREHLPGLNRERADVILAGAVLLRQIMRRGRFGELQIGGSGVREGLFYEHFLKHQPEPLFADMRGFSIQNLAYQYNYEPIHAEKVRELALALFDQLAPLHRYGLWERELLGYAATIHDIGVSVGYYDHHKHSAYLVLNSALQGFNHRETVLLALLTRLHRKGDVDVHPYQPLLATDDSARLARLAALLRIAEYLERSKSQVVHRLQVQISADEVRVGVVANGDATVEIWDANRRTGLFRKAFGVPIIIVEGSPA